MIGYYCDNYQTCQPISLEDIVIDKNNIGTYNGLAVGRNPGCWGVCKYKIKDQPHLQKFEEYEDKKDEKPFNYTFLVILLVTIFIIIIIGISIKIKLL